MEAPRQGHTRKAPTDGLTHAGTPLFSDMALPVQKGLTPSGAFCSIEDDEMRRQSHTMRTTLAPVNTQNPGP